MGDPLQHSWTYLVAQIVKNLPAMQTWVQSLGWEDPLEEGLATHSSILPGESPWTEETGGLQSIETKELDGTEQLRTSIQAHTQEYRNNLICICFCRLQEG